MEESRICKRCCVEKPINDFPKNSTNRGGYLPTCRECYNWNHRSSESKEKEQTKWRLLAIGLKYCPHCHTIKNINDFASNSVHNDGLRAYCKECDKTRALEYVQRDDIKKRKHEKESTREFLDNLAKYRQNSDTYEKRQKEYSQTPQAKAYRVEYGKRPHVKIRRYTSTRIWSELKIWNEKKKSTFNEYLGCTLEFYSSYLEDKFTEGMSWFNYGKGSDKWNVDHIKPCASFNMHDGDEVKKCFHYSNQQPMWQTDNLKKHSTYNGVSYRKNRSK